MEEAIAPIIIVLSQSLLIFGLGYYYMITRHRERMALLEAGAKPDLFKNKAMGRYYPLLVLGLLAMGIALGLIGGTTWFALFNDNPMIMGIFVMLGISASLLGSFFLIRRWHLNQEQNN